MLLIAQCQPNESADARFNMGMIFNIQRFSVHDGPGIRTTVFCKGCPLRCLWCSNPESQNFQCEVVHRDSLCNLCGKCIEACDIQAISIVGDGVRINRAACTGCGNCVESCVPQALTFYGEDISAEEAFRQVARDKPFYLESDGGMTVSGGEPLSQADFVATLFSACRDDGIHTCLDTCGSAPQSELEKVLPLVNLVLFDIKAIDPVLHQKITGKSNKNILQNLKVTADAGIPVIVRIPVIPALNDSHSNMADIAHHIAGIKGIQQVNLMPYHRFGESKYAMLDREYLLKDLTPQDASELENRKAIFESVGFDCEIVQG